MEQQTKKPPVAWMQTFTGQMFDLLDPRAHMVKIDDIAHGLGFECRYNGHTDSFYSVAQHSILVEREVRRRMHGYLHIEELCLVALLHDAHEAYIKDITRPLKSLLSGYGEIANRVQRAIDERFNLRDLEETLGDAVKVIKAVDFAILKVERDALMKEPPIMWDVDDIDDAEIAKISIQPWDPMRAVKIYRHALIASLAACRRD